MQKGRAISKLKNKRFGRLVVMFEFISNERFIKWLCVCDCGCHCLVMTSHLRSGHTKSCGCLNVDNASAIHVTHGYTSKKNRPPEYIAWQNMRRRCYDPSNKYYMDYGGRGIKVCNRWKYSFENFLKDMGNRPSKDHSLDRFPDKNGDYEPLNCRWGTKEQQSRNRRNNILICFKGEKLFRKDLAKKIGIKYTTLIAKLNRGEKIEEIIKNKNHE